MDWKEISPEEAAQHKHYGLGGWLLFFYVLAILGFVSSFINFINIQALKQFLGDQYIVILVVGLINALLILPFIVLSPMKHPMMPKVTIMAYWGVFALSVVQALLLGQPMMLISSAVIVIFVLLFSWYLNRSRRVNVTYRHRIRAEETAAPEAPPA